ncbi:hypothetical protein [Aestuariibacter salexigens]|uniref:hypothetical protein n=1 Tax=Aestuariibacter salexigens TaxID=226010 RepID=UPI0012EC69D2|nr:hypothetical protein [Aestuariibacter salexigens]
MGKKVHDIIDRANLRVRFTPTEPDSIDNFAADVSLDGLLITRTLVTDDSQFVFSDKPLIELQFYAYHLDDVAPVSDFSGLANRSIVSPIQIDVKRGPLKTALDDPNLNINVVAVQSEFEPQLELLHRNIADYAISYFSPSNMALLFSPRINQRDYIASELFSIPMHLALRSTVTDAEQLLAVLNEAMSE